ncbi:MAG: hypothetical protein HYY84_14520 [Deltaproteobacteria bacterium]|nr:hypothetical protein [Deltaproteobacteria bacterium]
MKRKTTETLKHGGGTERFWNRKGRVKLRWGMLVVFGASVCIASACSEKKKVPPVDVGETFAGKEPPRLDEAARRKADEALARAREETAKAPPSRESIAYEVNRAALGEPQGEPPPAVDDAPTKAGTGAAYFAVEGGGIVRLANKTFTTLAPDLKYVRAIVSGPGGALWTAGSAGVFKIEGGRARKIGEYNDTGGADKIAVDPAGTVWTASFRGVAKFEGGQWSLTPKATLGASVQLLNDIDIDKDGRVWVLSSNEVHVFEKGAWRAIDVSAHAGPVGRVFFQKLAPHPLGGVVMTTSSVLLRHDGVGWQKKIGVGSRQYGLREVAVGTNGQLHVVSFDTVFVVPPAGRGSVRSYSTKAGQLAAKTIRAMAADKSGRTWLATDNGIQIIEANGNIVKWLPGTIPQLTGAVNALTVEGAGPELPSVGPQAFGIVTGKVVRTGEPVSGIQIEICAQPSSYFRVSPCADSAWSQSVLTGTDGNFTFNNVPLGTYRFALKPGAKWTITMDSCCTGMKANKTFDVGSINLKAR